MNNEIIVSNSENGGVINVNYIILNNKKSTTIPGLIISTLPSIIKPAKRVDIQKIDGVDGDIITELGYESYDKVFEIGLSYNYDIDEVISYFNSSGEVIFSNEPNKIYYYEIYEQIDFNKLLRFKTAKIKMHVQPFKYKVDEEVMNFNVEDDQITITNEEIIIDDVARENKLNNVTIFGKSEQETTTGNNLFNLLESATSVTGIAFTKNSENSCNLVGDGTGSYRNVSVLIRNILPNQKYTLKYHQKNTNNNFVLWRCIVSYDTNNNPTTIINQKIASKSGIEIEEFYVFETPSDCSYISIRLYVTTTNAIENTATITNIQLIKGDYSSSDIPNYEPFTGGQPSPNPDYLQEIESVESAVYNDYGSKNLLNLLETPNTAFNDFIFSISEQKISINGVDNTNLYSWILITKKGVYTKNGTPSSSQILSWAGGTIYTGFVSRSLKVFNGTTDFTPQINLFDDSGVNVTNSLTNTTNIVAVGLYLGKNKTFDNFTFGVQINEGTTVETYEPYKSHTLNINLNDNKFRRIGDVADELIIDTKTGDYFKKAYIGEVVLDGSENWNSFKDDHDIWNYYVHKNDISKNATLCLSNYFVYTTRNNNLIGQFQIGGLSGNKNGNIVFNPANDTTNELSNFKTWLSTHNVIVDYLLEAPTLTKIGTLTEEELNELVLFEGYNNISIDTNINDSEIKIIYQNDEIIVNNEGNYISKPLINIYGSGNICLKLNGIELFNINLSNEEDFITLDIENMEAYKNNILKNRLVIGNYDNFYLNVGENKISWVGNVSKVEVSKYIRWI